MPIYNYVNEVQKKVEERLTHESVTFLQAVQFFRCKDHYHKER